MHPRLTPANNRVAHSSLKGHITAGAYSDGVIRQIAAPIADLLRQPGGALDSQLLRGADFLVLENADGWSFGQSVADCYVGYIQSDLLAEAEVATHRINALSSHLYSEPNMKSRTIAALPFAATLTAKHELAGFLELSDGSFVPRQHVQSIDTIAPDFTAVFERFLGVPYLWGGNSVWGMDCSGAVQLALNAAGLNCPRDTDMQESDLGVQLEPNAPPMRGDLVFWGGHVAMMQDSETMIHANAHHMAVASESLAGAVARILAKGDGPVTSCRRL